MAGGLLIGMYGAASLSNLICDPYDKVPDRKLTLLDCIANVDDALGVLVLAKFPCADKLHLERTLPFVYSYCGYRAGKVIKKSLNRSSDFSFYIFASCL